MLFLLSIFFIVQTNAQSEVFAPGGMAINGYDAVAFFKDSKPVKGSAMYSYQYKDAKWLFTSKENLDVFMGMPDKYTPQYGGYCAYGTSEGHKAPTQPETWTIVNDKLYFNYNKQVKQMWMKDQAQRIELADIGSERGEHLAIVGGRADHAPRSGAAEQEPARNRERRAERDDEQAVVRNDRTENLEAAA